MMNKNNESKGSSIQVSPAEIEKCFFAIEKEFQNFEILFILNQLRKRSDFKLKSDFALRAFGIEWIIWFLRAIHDDLTDVGKSLNRSMIMKLIAFKDSGMNEFECFEKQAWSIAKRNLK